MYLRHSPVRLLGEGKLDELSHKEWSKHRTTKLFEHIGIELSNTVRTWNKAFVCGR